MLVPVHVKSHYSLGFGTASIQSLVDRAAALGLPALALTDRENIYGQVIFHHLSRERGLQPVTGAEILGAGGSRVVLLARDRTGYQSLCRILTRRKLGRPLEDLRSAWPEPGEPAASKPKRMPSEDPVESLAGRSEGLFILTGDLPILERLRLRADIDRASLRLLLVRPNNSLTREREILEAARRLEVPLVADPDIAFLDPSDRRFHHLQVAIAENALITDVERRDQEPGRHFPGPKEHERLFEDLPEAVRETERLTESCELDLRKNRAVFPRLDFPPGETAAARLRRFVLEGLARRPRTVARSYRERIDRELALIEELGFCDYFLVVGDIVRFARERGIETVGRGSGAGSLVAHLLGVTNVDPIEHRLHFERFLHRGRSDLPDIDIDLCWIRRDEVIDYVYRAYGHDRVAMISSHNTFQPRSAFREAVKVFGVPPQIVDGYSKRFPWTYPAVKTLRDLILASPRTREIPIDEEPIRSALPLAERLLNQPHHLSVHPGGIVIADCGIDSYVALERATKGIVVTQYDMYSIEDVGLVKIDLLGNRCLTEIQETIDLAEDGPARLSDIPDGDPETARTLQDARTLGCFQLESPAMRSLLSKLPFTGLRECIAAVAIIRPGAAAGSAKDVFIRRANGEEPPSYLHPSLEEHLRDTYGVVVYEEDSMCIASAIAGIPLGEGEALRSAVKKCRHPDEVAQLERWFLARAEENGVPLDTARAAWRDLRRFAYCFSKAHASGYGLLAYQSTYLKTHFPVEFGCALLNNHAGMYSRRTIAEEIKRMGARILPPSVNRSQARCTLERGTDGKAVRVGLGFVKSLSSSAIESILARRGSRQYRSLADFRRRVGMPRREIEALILAGAFDEIRPTAGRPSPNHPQLLWELASSAPAAKAGEGASDLLVEQGEAVHPPLKPYSRMQRIQNELDVLEMALTGHPLRLLRDQVRRLGCVSTKQAAEQIGRNVTVAGIAAAVREIRTAKGELMQFLTLEDEHGLLESTLFPRVYRLFAGRLIGLGPYLVTGKVERDRRAVNLNVSKLEVYSSGYSSAVKETMTTS